MGRNRGHEVPSMRSNASKWTFKNGEASKKNIRKYLQFEKSSAFLEKVKIATIGNCCCILQKQLQEISDSKSRYTQVQFYFEYSVFIRYAYLKKMHKMLIKIIFDCQESLSN